jgi:hypothetical protein
MRLLCEALIRCGILGAILVFWYKGSAPAAVPVAAKQVRKP